MQSIYRPGPSDAGVVDGVEEGVDGVDGVDGGVDGVDGGVDGVAATLCSVEQFQCRDGGCISNSSTCNQKADCDDASDEMNCCEFNSDFKLF